MPLVKLENVNKEYSFADYKLQVLKDITLTINRGDFIAIMGPSGSGKSTLLNIIGLLDRPTSGNYFHTDKNITALDDDKLSKLRNKSVGFVFQSFNLFSQLNIVDNVEVPLIYSQVSKLERRKKSLDRINEVGLSQRTNHRPTQLSGGEQQRVAIARALVNEPNLLLADEPTGNLDESTSKTIIDTLCKLNDNGTTIVMVTHNPEIASRAHSTVIIRDGRIVK